MASNIPGGYARAGTWYEFFQTKAATRAFFAPGSNGVGTGHRRVPVSEQPAGLDPLVSRPRAGHDSAERLRRTRRLLHHPRRPAGDESVIDSRPAHRPCCLDPPPREGDLFPPTKKYYEIPIAIQDRSFNADGSLFYPDSRAFFDGVEGPYIPDTDISPIWNPEFFGNTIMVNGNTWPYLDVEQRRYRFRFLNGCDSRFLILDFTTIPGVEVWQIGNEGGFLAAPVNLTGVNGNHC